MRIFEPIFEALNAHGARYVVVGGVAVVLHGHVRLTGDLDIAIDLSPDEARKAIEALTSIGLRPKAPVDPEDFTVASIRQTWINEKGMQVFQLIDPDNPMREVDLFVENDIPFDELWRRSTLMEVGSTQVRVASVEDLIVMKEQAARPQDLLDIEALREIERYRNGS